MGIVGRALALLSLGFFSAAAGGFNAPARPAFVDDHFLDEGFDESFPPPDWLRSSTLSIPYTWHSVGAAPYVYEGAKSAVVKWRDGRDQNERLTSPSVDLSAATPTGLYLSFWYYTDPFWFEGAGKDFRVEGSQDEGDWEALWSVAGAAEAGWAWRNVVIDMSGHVGGDLRIRFHYEAMNAADVALDQVRLGYLDPPGPPENDDCAGALAGAPDFHLGPAPGEFALTGNNSFASSDYPLDAETSCTGYGHTGRDLVWVVDIPDAHRFTATMTTVGGWDDTLFLISDCADPQGSCVAGDRGFPDGASISWVNGGGSDRRLFLVVSAHSSGSGEFVIEAALAPETARAPASWGAVKSRYR